MAKNTPKNLEEIRIYNMVDMSLRYSGMIRLLVGMIKTEKVGMEYGWELGGSGIRRINMV